MNDRQLLQDTFDAIKKIEKIIIGDIDKPEEEGLISRVAKNEQFRRGFERVKARLYMVIIGLIGLSIVNIFGQGILSVLK